MEEEEDVVMLADDVVLKPIVKKSIAAEGRPARLTAVHLGWICRVLPKKKTFFVLDSDLVLVCSGALELPPDDEDVSVQSFNAVHLLLAVSSKRRVLVFDLRTKTAKFGDVFAKDLRSYEGAGVVLSPDCNLVFITRLNAEGAEFVCFSLENGVAVCSTQLFTNLAGIWFLNWKDGLIRAYCGGGQDGQERFKVHHDAKTNSFGAVEADADPVDVVDRIFFEIIDGNGALSFGPRSGGHLEVVPEDDEINFLTAIPLDVTESSALLLTDAKRFFIVKMDDPLVLREHVVLSGVNLNSVCLYRGFGSRIISLSEGGNGEIDFVVWQADPICQTYFEWIDWTPRTHRFFPAAFEKAVVTLFLCIKRVVATRFPKDMRNFLTMFLARAWLIGWRADSVIKSWRRRRK
jgi:hypothetical protein